MKKDGRSLNALEQKGPKTTEGGLKGEGHRGRMGSYLPSVLGEIRPPFVKYSGQAPCPAAD
jgi:hypothetical protein